MKTKIAFIAILLTLSTLAFYSSTTAFAQPAHETGPRRAPVMNAALRNLEQAKKFLQEASNDFGGHRTAALKACDQAIKECKLALDQDHK